jgi:integrase
MPKKVGELKALEVSRLVEPGLHFVGGVSGLALQVAQSGARSWILRYADGSKRREMGLGGFPDVGLADARTRAREERQKLDKGVDPILDRRIARSALKMKRIAAITFESAALAYMEAQEASWSNAKHAQQWRNSLESYAYPVIGSLLVSDVNQNNVLAVLEPIWKTKTETASRLRGRIEQVLDWATVRGYREGLNPARWRGHLDKLLPSPKKIAAVAHHAALPYAETGAFMALLRTQPGMGARALEFAILTAARSGEVRGATWTEIDLQGRRWVIPKDRMKANREHRVPLSDAVVEMLAALPRLADTDTVFWSPRGGELSDMALTAVLRRMNVSAVPHGFRSTFRDWAAECTNYPNEVAEMALAHAVGDKVEAAYRRGDLYEKRARLMDEWATYCARSSAVSAEVVPINAKRA